MHYKHFATGLLLLAGTVLSCKKDKSDYFYDNRPDTTVNGSSLVRLVNMSGGNQLIINGDTLTSFKILPPATPGGQIPLSPGTYWFPETGVLGTTFNIPRRFLQSGKAIVATDFYAYQGRRDSLSFEVTEDYNKPKDYYILQGSFLTTQELPRSVEVPRDVTAPAKAGYFKIRLVNMADQLKPQGLPVEDIAVPLTLTYADGTPVSTATSNIGTRQYSEYVELPYGTYQFKVLTPQGTQVTGSGGSYEEFTKVVDGETSTLTKGVLGIPHTISTYLTYAPVRTFQPGGIYTIAVGIGSYVTPYYPGGPGETVSMWQNGFQVIPDISEPANVNYFRFQAVNVLPETGTVTFKMNGQRISELAYAAHSDYGIYITGQPVIEAINAQGAVIATANVPMYAGLNYTAWLYKQPDGKAAISIVSNNLSGGYYSGGGNGQDGVNTRRQEKYPFHIRFLNFCPDLPYVSFTTGNGQPVQGSESTRNLQPGETPQNLPYVRFQQSADPYQFMAYRSTPAVYPGSWISEIPVLKSSDFIARPELYVRGPLPAHEPGIFTVALIGRLNSGQTEAQKARMIIVKHTK